MRTEYFNVRDEYNWLIGGPPIDEKSEAVDPVTVVNEDAKPPAKPRIHQPGIVGKDPRYIPILFFHTAKDRDAYEVKRNPVHRKWGETFDQWKSRAGKRSA